MSEPIQPLLNREAKVGLFALLTVAILFLGTFYLGQLEGWLAPGHEYGVTIDTAHELGVGTPVEVAGLRVGQIRAIQLLDGGQRAHVRFVVDKDVTLYRDALVQVQTVGFLGERYVNLRPGSAGSGALAPGDTIANSEVPLTIDDFMASIRPMLENLTDITQQLRDLLADERLSEGVPATLDALRRTAERLDTMVLKYEATVGELVVAAADTAGTLRDRLPELFDTLLGEGSGLNQVADAVTRTIERVDRVGESIEQTTADIREIVEGIERGEGTIGALLRDETTATEVKQVVSSLNDTLGRITRLQTIVEYLGVYHTPDRRGVDGFNNTFSLRLQPGFDRYYSFGVVVRDEDDQTERTRIIDELNSAGDVVTTVTTRERIQRNKLLFNLLFGKRFHDVTFRAGIIESSAGLGIDYALWQDRFWLRAEAFDFDRDGTDRPRVRAWSEVHLFNHLRIAAGVEDAISRDGPQALMGLGFFFTDQDLKLLFGAASGTVF